MEADKFFFEGSVVSVLTPEPIDKLLDYLVPIGGVYSGEFVEVELGRRRVDGIVWGVGISSLSHKKLKTLKSLKTKYRINLTARIFLNRMAKYNLTSLNSIFRLTGWKGYIPHSKKLSYAYKLSGTHVENGTTAVSRKGSRVIELLSSESVEGKLKTLKQISAAADVSTSVIKNLERKGIIEKIAVKNEKVFSRLKSNYSPKLSLEQRAASDKIRKTMEKGRFGVTMLRGITGSGKTEVFLSVASKIISDSQQVLILVPEIVLSSGLVSRIYETLGIMPAEWNSGIKGSRKKEIFDSLMSDDGQIQVVVGARSALFLPFKKLGLIIIDEEHDISFKQQDGIRFNARDMGVLRAHCEKIHIILSSATPSLETILNCKVGKYKRIDIKKRFREEAKILTKVIDMKNEDIKAEKSLSPQLTNLVAEHLNRGEQILLFLNRRGYAPLVVCKGCGAQLDCKFCDSKLVEHRDLNCRICHQCGQEFPINNSCSNCGAEDQLNLLGFGVERLKEECNESFPGKKVKIISSDLTHSGASLEEGIMQIEKGEIDIIIGTQIIAKGHNFPFLSLVGIIDGDLGLYGGDLRGSERTYQIIQQVSGRVGRFGKEGTVAIQSWTPENQIITSILKGDEEEFWEKELINRRDANSPPYSKFIAIILEGRNKGALFSSGQIISNEFEKFSRFGVKIFGPALAPISKIRDRIRVRLLIQCPKSFLHATDFYQVLKAIKVPKSQKIVVDVDPQNFL